MHGSDKEKRAFYCAKATLIHAGPYEARWALLKLELEEGDRNPGPVAALAAQRASQAGSWGPGGRSWRWSLHNHADTGTGHGVEPKQTVRDV